MVCLSDKIEFMIEIIVEFKVVCDIFVKSDFVIVDIEFLCESIFWLQLCLIQIVSFDYEVLIDLFVKGLDFKLFFDLMIDVFVVKVFYVVWQDFEIIYYFGGVIFYLLFDMQVVVMVCGFGDFVFYDQFVQKIIGKYIDKLLCFIDWSYCLFSQKQFDYVLVDVIYLCDIYVLLKVELECEGCVYWFEDEMVVLEMLEIYDLYLDDVWIWMKMCVCKLSELVVLMKVIVWCECEVCNCDVLCGCIFKDDVIYEIVQQQLCDFEVLGKLCIVLCGWECFFFGVVIIVVVNEVFLIFKEELFKIVKFYQFNEGMQLVVEFFKVFLKLMVECEGVVVKIIVNMDDFEKIVFEGEKVDVVVMYGWCKELFGDCVLKLIDGQFVIKFVNCKIEVVEFDLFEVFLEV